LIYLNQYSKVGKIFLLYAGKKGSKSGYMPAYFYDKYRYRTHMMKGGTFQNFTEKAYLSYSDEQIEKHLKGLQLIGI
jgi:hypothetical protein